MIRNVFRTSHSFSFLEKYNNLISRYLDKININEIEENLSIRNENYETNILCKLLNQYRKGNNSVKNEIFNILNDLPNLTSITTPVGKDDKSIILKITDGKKTGKNAQDIGKSLSQLRIEHVSDGAENRTYYFNGDFARLERAVMRYTLDHLLSNDFKLISVPDIISYDIVRQCGFKIHPNKNQIYGVVTRPEQIYDIFNSSQISSPKCLSGTSEMALAAYLNNTIFDIQNLPVKLCAVSRCYRREVSEFDSHLYRVHQFFKVEMFCVTEPSKSHEMLDHIVNIQESIVSSLGLEFRVLEMPSEELGNPAYRKIDIESWMPGENRYGEISSASNCTDYQSKRMNIFYQSEHVDLDFVHTLNGTGCAIPRILKSIIETHSNENGIVVPFVLRKYMGNVEKIKRQFPPHKVTWIEKLE